MSVTYLGSLSLDLAIPGLKGSLDAVGGALNTLRSAVGAQMALLQTPLTALEGAVSDLDATKSAFISGPIDALNGQVESAQDALTAMSSLGDVGAFFASTLAAIDAGRAIVAALSPEAYVAQQIAGLNAGVDGLQGQLDGMVSGVDDMTDVSSVTSAQVAAIQSVKNAVDQAVTAALVGTIAYAEQLSQFAAPGVHAFWAAGGTLSGLGGEVAAAVPGTGMSGATVVAGPLLVVDATNTAALAALQAMFGT